MSKKQELLNKLNEQYNDERKSLSEQLKELFKKAK